jgi:hypothetical protein
MDLREYLEKIRNCPDELRTHEGREIPLITYEFGIYDNFPILLQADFDKVLEYLTAEKFAKVWECDRDLPKRRIGLHYIPGTVELQVAESIYGAVTYPNKELPGSADHNYRQEREFNMSIMLHPYQKRKIENLPSTHALARVIGEIGDYAIRNNLPLCIPRSNGWGHESDLSRIVYFS